jgi:hypothetical protein
MTRFIRRPSHDGQRYSDDHNGGADGAVYAMKAQTGARFTYAITKRGINNRAVINGTTVIASQRREPRYKRERSDYSDRRYGGA